jgi:hypothetical protein
LNRSKGDRIGDGVIIEKVYCVRMVVCGKRQILAFFVIYGNYVGITINNQFVI